MAKLRTRKIRTRAMTYRVFERKFKPIKNHLNSNASGDGDLFELGGDEGQFVSVQKVNHVWTVIQSGDGTKEYLTTGIHHVNALNYLITENPWTDFDEQTGLEVLYSS